MLVRCGVTVRQIAATCLPAISVAAVTKWWRQAGRGNERLLCFDKTAEANGNSDGTWWHLKKDLIKKQHPLPVDDSDSLKKGSFLTQNLNHPRGGCDWLVENLGSGLSLESFDPEFPRSILQALRVGLFSSTLSSLGNMTTSPRHQPMLL